MTKLEEWIDYMEGEADLKTMAKLGLLLEHSRRDREILQNLMRVRQMIELSDPALDIHEFVEDPSYMERLHARTMARIKKNPRPLATEDAKPAIEIILEPDSAGETPSNLE